MTIRRLEGWNFTKDIRLFENLAKDVMGLINGSEATFAKECHPLGSINNLRSFVNNFLSSAKEISRYRRDTTIGISVLSTNKIAQIQNDKIFYSA